MTLVIRTGAALIGATALVLACSTGSYADEDYGGNQDDNGNVDVIGHEGGQTGSPGSVGGITIRVPGPWTQRVYVPACDTNSVRATGPGVSEYVINDPVLCTAFSSCPAEGDSKYYAYERQMGADNRAPEDDFGFDTRGSVCRSIDDPSESEPPTISVEDIMEKARALAPTPTFVIEPAAKSYVNIPTNFAANAEPVTENVVVLGMSIPVEFIPGDVTWNFGDGGSAQGVGVRHATVGQSGAVEHAYARSGAYDVSVTVGYSARILVPGRDPIVFPTPVARAAAPQSLDVGEIQSVVTEVD